MSTTENKETPKAVVGNSTSFWAESAARAKTWAAVAFTFFAVIAFALFLFNQHSRVRAAEIDAQLTQNAARLGQEVEVKYKNYRTVVDNVTRMMSAAVYTVATSHLATLQDAKAAAEGANHRELDLGKLRDSAARRKTVAQGLKSNMANLDREAAKRADAQRQRFEDAGGGAATADHDATTADHDVQTAVDQVVQKERLEDQRHEELAQCQERLDFLQATAAQPSASPNTATSAAPPPAVAPAPSASAAANPAAAPGDQSSPVTPQPSAVTPEERDKAVKAVEDAKHALDAARADLEQSRTVLVDRRATAERKYKDAAVAYDQVEVAFVAMSDAESVHAATSDATHAVTNDANTAVHAAGAAEKNLAEQRALAASRNAELQRLSNPTDAVKAQEYLSALKRVVLPSQKKQLDGCAGEGDVANVKLCVARSIAAISNGIESGAEGLEIVECPSASPDATLSADGRYVYIPSSRSSDISKFAALPDEALPPCGRVKLSRFLAGSEPSSRAAVAGSGSTAFEAILLLQRDGTAVYSLNVGSNLRVTALPNFDPKRAATSSVLANVPVGVANYRAFLQPVRIRLGHADAVTQASELHERADLLVCGLAREDALKKASYELGLPSYLWVVLLLGVGLLSLPLAKVWLLGPKTSFGKLDVTLLVSSALLLTLLGCVVVLGFLAHNRLTARAETQLTQVGRDMARQLADETRTAATELSKFRASDASKLQPLLANPGEETACADVGGAIVNGVLFEGGGPGKAVCERIWYSHSKGKGRSEASPPKWKLIFLLDASGDQRLKVVQNDVDSTPVSVKSRPYFTRAFGNTTACLGPEGKPCSIRGVPELVRSVTSGDIVLVVAQPTCPGTDTCGRTDKRNGVVAVETEMRQFRSFGTPLGVQVAVIDESGRIVLHSNNDAHHEQNIFGEVDDPRELRAAIATRVPDTVRLSYLGEPSQLHIEPLGLPGAGWSVLTVAPMSIVDVASTDMVLAAVSGYGLLILVVVLFACCAVVVRQAINFGRKKLDDHAHDHDHEFEIRPRASRSPVYARIGLYAMTWGIGLAVAAIVLTPMLPTLISLVLVLLLWGMIVYRLRARANTDATVAKAAPWGYLPLTYLLFVAGLAQAFVVAPAVVLFTGAYDCVVDNLVRAEQNHYAEVLASRPACLDAVEQNQRPQGSKLLCDEVFSSGQEDVTNHAPPSSGPPTSYAAAGNFALWPMLKLADLLPGIGSSDGNAGRLYQNETNATPSPATVEYESVRWPLATEIALASSDPAAPKTLLTTRMPRLFSSEFSWFDLAALLLVSAAALAATYAVGFQTLRRLFFLNLLADPSSRKTVSTGELLGACREANPASRLVLVCYAGNKMRRTLEASDQCQIVSLANSFSEPEDTQAKAAYYLISNLDDYLNDAVAAKRLLSVSRWASRLIVLSSKDPLRTAQGDLRDAWSRALQGFAILTGGVERACLAESATPAELRALAEHWWYESDLEERRVLAQLAIGGYVAPHPANARILESLASRGVIDGDTLTITSDELEVQAREATSPEEQATWEAADRGTPWAALRVPLSTGVAALLAAVAAAKPELGAAGAIVPTLTASLPTVLKVLTQMLTRKSAG